MTTEKELNLSEKILEKDNRYYLDIAWIKEFIKLLKEEIHTELTNTYWSDESKRLNEIINKLAGKDLT